MTAGRPEGPCGYPFWLVDLRTGSACPMEMDGGRITSVIVGFSFMPADTESLKAGGAQVVCEVDDMDDPRAVPRLTWRAPDAN